MQKIMQLFNRTVAVPWRYFYAWRSFFGLYFVYYAYKMFPYAEEIYGNSGIVPYLNFNWTYGYFPNIFSLAGSTQFVFMLHGLLILFGIMLAIGCLPRTSAFILWYLQTALYNRNVLTDDPSMAFVGLLLLTLTLIPNQLTLFGDRKKDVLIPYFVFFMPVFIFCITFTVSGLDKMSSNLWLKGTALYHMIELGIARNNFIVHFLLTHSTVTHFFSYVAVLTQIICLPLFVFGYYRWSLFINFISFTVIFILLDLNQVIYGMLFFYSFFLLRDLPGIVKLTRLIKIRQLW